MAKVTVKLARPENTFKDDDKVRHSGHESFTIEETERVTQAIQIGLLQKVSAPETTKSRKADDKS